MDGRQNVDESEDKTTVMHRVLFAVPFLLVWSVVVVFWILQLDPKHFCSEQNKECIAGIRTHLYSLMYYKSLFWCVITGLFVLAFQLLQRHETILSFIILSAAVQFYFLGGYLLDMKCSLKFFLVFDQQERDEKKEMRTILFAGYPIGEYLIKVAGNADAPHRLSAIKGLAQVNFHPALDKLKRIASDSLETQEVRTLAKEAVKKLDH